MAAYWQTLAFGVMAVIAGSIILAMFMPLIQLYRAFSMGGL